MLTSVRNLLPMKVRNVYPAKTEPTSALNGCFTEDGLKVCRKGKTIYNCTSIFLLSDLYRIEALVGLNIMSKRASDNVDPTPENCHWFSVFSHKNALSAEVAQRSLPQFNRVVVETFPENLKTGVFTLTLNLLDHTSK